ncbi:unnamed protein product [Candidula unifasciata]|uniref:G-protein coupled receptors family 1 profile domain-containing protein n=1 Tax=Candidula unifasciata TaxID=100452 RepID=A0A8S3Z3E5_9EUPU|nr:unnamed protein product [Candidula unifasciata]
MPKKKKSGSLWTRTHDLPIRRLTSSGYITATPSMYNISVKHLTCFDVISNEEYAIILIFCTATWSVFSLCGIISNFINIKTFVAMGLNDGITVSFLALSIFDFAYLVFSFCLGISSAFRAVESLSSKRFDVEPYGVSVFVANVLIMVAVTNVLTTTFLAVARCMCVAKPLHFKNYFTVKRTVYFMSGFAIFAVTVYMPLLANMGMLTRFDNKTKISRPSLWVSKYKEPIKNVLFVIIDTVLPVSSQIIVLMCILVMASSLRASAMFRQASGIQRCDKNNADIVSCSKDKKTDHINVTEKLCGKDLRVVQQVVLISLVYVVCNTPRILISVAGLLEPEFRIGKRYNNLYLSLNAFRKHVEIFNATTNTFIYYKFNTKFRNTLFSKGT